MRERVELFLLLTFASAFDAITTRITVLEASAEEASPVLAAVIQHTSGSSTTSLIFLGGLLLPLFIYTTLGRVNKLNLAVYSIWGMIFMQLTAATNNLIVKSPQLQQNQLIFISVYLVFTLFYTRGIYIDRHRDKLRQTQVQRRIEKGWTKIENVRDRLSLANPN